MFWSVLERTVQSLHVEELIRWPFSAVSVSSENMQVHIQTEFDCSIGAAL